MRGTSPSGEAPVWVRTRGGGQMAPAFVIRDGTSVLYSSGSARRWRFGRDGALRKMAPTRLRGGGRTGPRRFDAPQRPRHRQGGPRLSLRRSPRHRQDHHCSHTRQGGELRRPHRRRTLQHLPLLRGHQPWRRPRPDRDGRGQQPRHRRRARAARQDRLRPQRPRPQGVPARRGAHAHHGRLQCPAQDA